MELLDFLARPLLAFGRFLLWLAWDFFVYTILWTIGWPVWRFVTFGRFPHVGIREYEDAGAIEALMVCAVGLVLLLAGIWLLSKYLGVAF
ncbi:MAG TPA: hypothetical protein VF471_07860 [Pseudoxanthomonas sp.]